METYQRLVTGHTHIRLGKATEGVLPGALRAAWQARRDMNARGGWEEVRGTRAWVSCKEEAWAAMTPL